MTRPPEKPDDKPLFPEQTRAPYHKAAPYKVTTITDKLHLPWCIAFLPDGKLLVTREISRAICASSVPTARCPSRSTGLAGLASPGKLGLLDVVLAPDFARKATASISPSSTICPRATATPIWPMPCWMRPATRCMT